MKNKALIIGGSILGIFLLSKSSNASSVAKRLFNKYQNVKESDSKLKSIITEFWRYAGLSEAKAKSFTTLNYAWSSAFISYVMIKAGFKNFPVSTTHTCYASKIRDGKYDRFSLQRTYQYKPKVGDIVLKNRGGESLTFDKFSCGDISHGDIVVKVEKGRLITIGGNVKNQISETHVSIDQNGYINDGLYFAIVKVD